VHHTSPFSRLVLSYHSLGVFCTGLRWHRLPVCVVICSNISFPSLISTPFRVPFRSSRDLIRRIWNPITAYCRAWKLSFLQPACLHRDVIRCVSCFLNQPVPYRTNSPLPSLLVHFSGLYFKKCLRSSFTTLEDPVICSKSKTLIVSHSCFRSLNHSDAMAEPSGYFLFSWTIFFPLQHFVTCCFFFLVGSC
jgi:hypothetical protein